MDISALSSLVLRIFNNTTTTTRQQNKHTKSGCGWRWGVTTLFDIGSCHSDWLIVFSLNRSLCTCLSIFEAQGISTENMGTGEHKIQIMQMIYNTNTLPVFRHTHPKSMETEANDWSHRNNRLFVLSLSPSFPLCVPSVSRQADSDIGPFSEQDSRQSDLALITVLSRFLGTLSRRGERRPGRPRWEMGGRCVRFSIMTHRCRITLEIKSKMLNFNQATLMARCEEWSLCLHWQAERRRDFEERERETGTRTPGETRWYSILIHQIACEPVMIESI